MSRRADERLKMKMMAIAWDLMMARRREREALAEAKKITPIALEQDWASVTMVADVFGVDRGTVRRWRDGR